LWITHKLLKLVLSPAYKSIERKNIVSSDMFIKVRIRN
jgi:hypothetical protein